MSLEAQTSKALRAVDHNDLSLSSSTGESQMAKSATLKSPGKRRGVAQRPAKQSKKYAPEPTLEEYKTFPEGYRLEEGSYPAEEILQVKGIHGPEEKRRYLVQWEPHPLTLRYFEPTWVS